MSKPTRVVDQQPAARRTSRGFTFGIALTLEREVEGVPVRTTVFAPALQRPRDRSKYNPRECFKQGKR